MYAVMRLAKLKSATKGRAAAHNHRTGDNQPNINKSRSHLNMTDTGDMVDKINKLLPAKRRKDAVEAVETVLTASPEFFDRYGSNPEQIAKNPAFKQWARASIEWVKTTFGAGNVVDYAVHLDELTPHIHCVFVPLVNGRLCFKDLSGKANMQKYQDAYAAQMRPFGLERGLSASTTGAEHVGLKAGRKALQRAAKAKTLPLPVMPATNALGVYPAKAVEKLHKTAMEATLKANDLLKERELLKLKSASIERGLADLTKRKDTVFRQEQAIEQAVNTLAGALECSPAQVPAAIAKAIDQAKPKPAPVAPVDQTPDHVRRAIANYREPVRTANPLDSMFPEL